MSRLKTFLLLNCLVFTGFLGNDLPEPTIHYKQEYHQVCLHVSDPPPHKNPQWTFKNIFLGDDKDTNPMYRNKVTINLKNMTLCINNISKSDIGLYEFKHTNLNYTVITRKHRVVMEEKVPKPQMTVKSVLLSNQSALPCNFTVTCSIQNHLLVSFCEEKSCETSQRTFGNLNISVYVENKTVVCSGNNHVSATAISQSLPPKCFPDDRKPNDDKPKTSQSFLYAMIGFFSALFIAAFLIAYGISKFRHHQATLSTVRITQSAPLQRDQRPEPRLSESSSSDAEPSYENLDDTQIREKNSPTEDQEVKGVERVDTVYSVLGAATSSIQPDSRKSAAQNDLTSEYANEPQITAETDCKSQQEKKEQDR